MPSRGFVFWPVGNGDCTTIIIDEDTVIQVDLNHLESAEEENDPHSPIIDNLVGILPKVNGNPYLSVFVLSHPDQDHCRGFTELLNRVTIGEIWHSPRIFREYSKDLSDDAKAFQKEAKRRVKEMIKHDGNVEGGDRLHLIGYDDLLKEDEFEDFPREYLTVPGNTITIVDGQDLEDLFEAFVHAPFKDDSSRDRNDTSLAMQVNLKDGDILGRAMLLGDHCYPTLKKIFDRSDSEDLKWNVFLAPHHCSKSVMYWKDEGDDEEKLKQDILDDIENAADQPGYIVASSEPIPSKNAEGDNPPHAKAKNRYEEIVPDDFICTQEHPNEENPEPVVFELNEDGFNYLECGKEQPKSAASLKESVKQARGSDSPKEQVGFGL
ncbi:MAG: hypothetical protein JRJ66_13065 [Deltaproteobacteria bacterium]|nr:hypothetical protein [Deltaproteobacteria bacterium]MBW2083252.1 hypothetical protein [Deltaproteobacteria bacterium]MBW2301134.1 hypothetical protein [Deltaproteobacteria bacterium]